MNQSKTLPLPRLLPVIDVLGGQVVWGMAGQRDSYQPLDSPLVKGARPLEVARALCDLVGHNALYLADLDAIGHDAPDWRTLNRLIDNGFRLVVDAGLRDAVRATRLAEAGVCAVVAASETLPGRQTLVEIVSSIGGERTFFSLDLKQGQVLTNHDGWEADDPIDIARQAVATGIGGMIVLDLAGVGVGQGVPTRELCRQIRDVQSDLPLITGGGVRSAQDVEALLTCGVDSLLVASALHRGTLRPAEIAVACRTP